jgi:hypothetical protein
MRKREAKKQIKQLKVRMEKFEILGMYDLVSLCTHYLNEAEATLKELEDQ